MTRLELAKAAHTRVMRELRTQLCIGSALDWKHVVQVAPLLVRLERLDRGIERLQERETQ